MKAMVASRAFLALLFVLVSSAFTAPARGAEEPATDDQGGELTFYSSQSSIGIVASRIFRDEEGRVTKAVYYGLRPELFGKVEAPYTEQMVFVDKVDLYAYDGQGREIRHECYAGDMRLLSVAETAYDDEGERSTITCRNAAGVRTRESRRPGSRKGCTLHFDTTGEGLVGIEGVVPEDIDLVHGWGKDMHGLSCGLAAERSSGTLAEIVIRATVRNRGAVADEITSGRRIILLDADERVVPPKDERAQDRRDDQTWRESIDPGTARMVVQGELARWYSDVEPGDYILILVCRDSEGDYSVVSNQLAITIEPSHE